MRRNGSGTAIERRHTRIVWPVLVCAAAVLACAAPAQAYDGKLVSMVVSPNPVSTGVPFTVAITASNVDTSGPTESGGIRWEATGASFGIVGVECPQGFTSNPGVGAECLGTIGRGQTVTMTVTATVDEPGTYNDSATVFPTPDATPADDTMTGSFTSVGTEPQEGGEGGGKQRAGSPHGEAEEPEGEPSPTAAPRLSSLTISPARFHAAAAGATFSRASGSPSAVKRAPTGALVTYVVDQNATADFAVLHAASGRVVGGSCVAPMRANRRKRSCVRYVALSGTVAVNAVEGTDRLRFSGRWHGRGLLPGGYELTLHVTNASGKASTSKRVAFHII